MKLNPMQTHALYALKSALDLAGQCDLLDLFVQPNTLNPDSINDVVDAVDTTISKDWN